jgi:hypothetical protein
MQADRKQNPYEDRTMQKTSITRRQFIEASAAVLTGGVMLSGLSLSAAEQPVKRTAIDQVPLGKSGVKLSRLGIGVGSNSGKVQRDLGDEGFNKLVRYAYERGITYIDTADGYKTHAFVQKAIKGLPREKFFIQTKIGGTPEKPLEELDRFRKELGVDYIDSVLVHCMVTADWDKTHKAVMDALEEAKQKKIIRVHGMSCHSLPALKRSVELDWVDVHLVRVNPGGVYGYARREVGCQERCFACAGGHGAAQADAREKARRDRHEAHRQRRLHQSRGPRKGHPPRDALRLSGRGGHRHEEYRRGGRGHRADQSRSGRGAQAAGLIL